MYFDVIPKIYYDSYGNKNPKIVTNLLRRVGLRNKVSTNTLLFDTYSVREGETPEVIAHKLYGDSQLHWIIMLVNNVVDRYHDWPMSTPQFNSYINQKYVDSDGNPNPSGVHHYEISQTSGDTSVTIEVPNNTGANIGAATVTNYEYEQRLQDKKRQIRLLDPKYIPSVVEEYTILMNETSI